MSTHEAPDLAVDAERLAQLSAETGDYRLQRAAEALRELRRDDARAPEAWPDLVRLMASRFATDCRSSRAKAICLDIRPRCATLLGESIAVAFSNFRSPREYEFATDTVSRITSGELLK